MLNQSESNQSNRLIMPLVAGKTYKCRNGKIITLLPEPAIKPAPGHEWYECEDHMMLYSNNTDNGNFIFSYDTDPWDIVSGPIEDNK